MKIVFCSSEVFPFAKTGGLADVCGALPLALEELDHEVIIFLPKYKITDNEIYNIQKLSDRLSKSTYGQNIVAYFIENDDFFNREGLYGDSSGDYKDNLDRFNYYCQEVLRELKEINFKPDIIHCNDWQTALIPVFLKEKYGEDEFFQDVKTLFTIHNLAFQGIFSQDQFYKLGINDDLFHHEKFEFFDQINLLKAALIYSDEISTVSCQYAKEIQTKEFGCGLESVLISRFDQIDGIVNGVDYEVWNPAFDKLISRNYSGDSFREEKCENKLVLRQEVGLPGVEDYPIFGFVGRLSHQKGIDLIIDSLEKIIELDLQVIIQGVGESCYCDRLIELSKKYPEKIALHFEFDEKTAHQIYAGCDFFLMPSRFEPCGLSQLISLKYGTIPLVYKTGGLADTIEPFNLTTSTGNGFVFSRYTKTCFFHEIEKALKVFHKKSNFQQLVDNAFLCNFSWVASAKKYVEVYQKLISSNQK